jgi:hypothetical protein
MQIRSSQGVAAKNYSVPVYILSSGMKAWSARIVSTFRNFAGRIGSHPASGDVEVEARPSRLD